VDDVVPLSIKTVKVNPGDDGAESQVNLLGRKAPRSSISHEQDTTVHEFDPDETPCPAFQSTDSIEPLL
jgi:hypothetical protein